MVNLRLDCESNDGLMTVALMNIHRLLDMCSVDPIVFFLVFLIYSDILRTIFLRM